MEASSQIHAQRTVRYTNRLYAHTMLRRADALALRGPIMRSRDATAYIDETTGATLCINETFYPNSAVRLRVHEVGNWIQTGIQLNIVRFNALASEPMKCPLQLIPFKEEQVCVSTDIAPNDIVITLRKDGTADLSVVDVALDQTSPTGLRYVLVNLLSVNTGDVKDVAEGCRTMQTDMLSEEVFVALKGLHSEGVPYILALASGRAFVRTVGFEDLAQLLQLATSSIEPASIPATHLRYYEAWTVGIMSGAAALSHSRVRAM